jgi:hypothetical protein
MAPWLSPAFAFSFAVFQLRVERALALLHLGFDQFLNLIDFEFAGMFSIFLIGEPSAFANTATGSGVTDDWLQLRRLERPQLSSLRTALNRASECATTLALDFLTFSVGAGNQ